MAHQDGPELFEAARLEAEAIVEEAKEQARQLLTAADNKRRSISELDAVRGAGEELAEKIERSIAGLQQILEELRAQLG